MTIKAVSSLARYVAATTPTSSENSEAAEAALEELRDLSVEIEGDDLEASGRDKWLVRVLAGTAFARASEVEEALETLGLNGGNQESVEACVFLRVDPAIYFTFVLRNVGSPWSSRSSSLSTDQTWQRKNTKSQKNGQRMTFCSNSSSLPSTSSPGKRDTQTVTPFTPSSWRILLCRPPGCLQREG